MNEKHSRLVHIRGSGETRATLDLDGVCKVHAAGTHATLTILRATWLDLVAAVKEAAEKSS